MRLTQKKIEETIIDLLGEEGLPLVNKLYEKENVSEFDLAIKTKKDIKIIRRMLYILYNHSLVSFIRKKDKQKGWYIYYWTLSIEGIKFAYIKKRRELLEKLKLKLDEERKELFFVCPNNCVRLNFDQAADFEFHCPECGELISQDNSKEKILILEKQISEVGSELKILLSEEKRPPQKISKKGKKSYVPISKKKKLKKNR